MEIQGHGTILWENAGGYPGQGLSLTGRAPLRSYGSATCCRCKLLGAHFSKKVNLKSLIFGRFVAKTSPETHPDRPGHPTGPQRDLKNIESLQKTMRLSSARGLLGPGQSQTIPGSRNTYFYHPPPPQPPRQSNKIFVPTLLPPNPPPPFHGTGETPCIGGASRHERKQTNHSRKQQATRENKQPTRENKQTIRENNKPLENTNNPLEETNKPLEKTASHSRKQTTHPRKQQSHSE